MKNLFIIVSFLWAIPAFAMPVCYDNATPTVVSSIGKTVPSANETCFDHSGSLVHSLRTEFYTISGGNTLVPKSQGDVDGIKATLATALQAREASRDNRRSEIANKLAKLSDAQINNYIDTNVVDLASVRAYLKRLTKVTRDGFINLKADK